MKIEIIIPDSGIVKKFVKPARALNYLQSDEDWREREIYGAPLIYVDGEECTSDSLRRLARLTAPEGNRYEQ